MVLKLNLSEDLAARLRHHRDALPRILELGLREMHAASQPGFQGLAEVLETLASLPTPEEVLELRPSPALEDRILLLLEKNRAGGLTPDEEREWESYEYLEHLMRIAKAKALAHLSQAS